jgi:hypothetical protein
MAYPILFLGDYLVAQAFIPAHMVWAHALSTFAAAYGFVWLLGVYRTMLGRPHVIEGGILHVHRGVLGSAEIAVDQIASVLAIDAGDPRPVARGVARLDVGGGRVLIEMRAPLPRIGRTRNATKLVVSADEPAALRDALRQRDASDTSDTRDARAV